ncbi:MAG TPA: tetratricopeptide repeat protein [Tepidisphaeraceae bacterium]|jgi:tetratricopeptide (TPR) repeat protein|nr:tetratricopeptide repeat protein [Tepidisphaeraceae bacterium]
MKRRVKVNTKFLVGVTVVVVGGGAAAVLVHHFNQEKPEQAIAAGKSDMEKGNYEKAAKDYARAFGLGGKHDLSLLMKSAEAWGKLAEIEPVYTRNEVETWKAALEINRTYVPALEKMTEIMELQAKQAGPEYRAQAYTGLRDYAGRLAAADPTDKGAAAKVPMSMVQGWLVGLATDPKTLSDAMAELVKIEPGDPANAEIPTVLAEAHLKQASDAGHRLDTVGADREVKAAAGVFEGALKGQDNNVEMHSRAASIYAILARGGRTDADKKMYAERSAAEIARVRAIAKPTDESSVDDLMTVGMLLLQSGEYAQAEAVMKGLAEAQPDDQAVRLGYARVLSSTAAGKQRAIEVLSAPVKASTTPKAKQYELQTLLDLSNLLIERYPEAKDTAEKDGVIKRVEGNLVRLKDLGGESALYLRLLGRVQLMKGQDTEGIQTLVRAQAMMQQQGHVDDQLMFTLAEAYMNTRQTGEAKTLLLDMLGRHPDFIPARRMLAQMLLTENDGDDAEPQIAMLEKALPDDPDVKRLRMALYMLRKQPEEARKLYEGLPEGNLRSKMGKAQIAIAVGNYQDAVRLLDAVRKDDPKNQIAVRLLVTAYRAQKDTASALRVVDEAIAANPADLMLVGLRKQLAGASGEEMAKYTREMVEKNPDPYMRELQLAAIATDEVKGAEAMEHLKKAEQIKPDDRQVQEALFQAYMKDAKWDLATQYADKLGKANADKAGGALYKFRLLIAQGKYPEALAAAQDLSGKMPEFAQTWVTLAQAQQANGHLDQAVQAYQRALDKQSDNADAMRGLIDCYYMQGKPDDALRYIVQARRTFPTNVYFKDVELRHALQYGDPDQAVAQWEDERKQNPDSRSNWQNLAQADWRALTTHVQKNDAEGAKKYGDALLALTNDGIKKWPDERLFYAYQADLAALRGDLNTGVAALKQLAAQPAWAGKPEPLLLLSDYYQHAGKLAEAEASARQAMTLAGANGGDDSAARTKLASIQASGGHVDDAIKTLDAHADNAGLMRQKLQLLVATRRYDSAEKVALALLEKDPKSPDLINGLVSIYLESGQFDQALARVNQVLSTDPQNIGALYGRGLVYLRRPKADLDLAIADLKVVCDRDPRNAEARYYLAEAMNSKGDVDGALREMDAAIRIQPDSKVLRLRMVQICSAATPPRWVDAERILTEGRAIPALASDPEMAVAETRMWIARRQADRAVDVARAAVNVTKGNGDVIRAYMDALLAAGSYQRLLDETGKMVAQPDTTPWWTFTDRAIALRRLDKKDDALKEFALALNTKDAKEHEDVAGVILGNISDELGVDEALARIAPMAEGNPRWQLLQASLYEQKHDYTSAIGVVEKIMTGLDKLSVADRSNVLRFAGSLYLSVQPTPMVEKALDAFKLTLKDNPNDTAVLNNIASILTDYVDPARPQEALQYSQRAYDLTQKSGRVEPLVLDTQGRVLTMVNRVPEGIVLLQEAADRTSIPDVHYHLAEAYMMQNAPEEAQRHLVQASAGIEKLKKDHQPIDPKMVKRIDELTAQAKKMVGSKAQAGAQ